MRRNEPEDYGQKFDYDPQWKGPLTIERKPTDTGFLVFFILYIIVYMDMRRNLCTGEMNADMLDSEFEWELDQGRRRNKTILENPILRFRFTFSGRAMLMACAFTVVAMLITYLSLFLISYHPKTLYYATSIFIVFVYALITGVMIAFIPYTIAQEKEETAVFLLIMSVVFFVIIMVTIGYLIHFRKKVNMACGVIKESVKAFMFFPSALFIPILEITLYAITIVFYGLTYLHLLGHPMLKYQDHKPIQYYILLWTNLFGLYWTLQFISAFTKMVLSGTYATWYWSLNKDQIPPSVVCRFLQITMRFHIGTLAFGSLIIAIFHIIRAALESKKEESRRRGDLRVLILIICISFLFSCVEHIVYFVNANAYIMCTIHGTDFIQSGKDAFHMIKRNLMNFYVMREVTGTITCPVVLLVFTVSLGGTYLFCRHMTEAEIMAAMLVVTILTLFVTALVFKVLGVAIDTIFLCALEDFERNDGSNARPNFMSPQLKELLILNS